METTAERKKKIEDCIVRHDAWIDILREEGLDICHAESFLEELLMVLDRVMQMAPDDQITDPGFGCHNCYDIVVGICKGIWHTDPEDPTLYVLQERCKTCMR